jgi:hypothetical protein
MLFFASIKPIRSRQNLLDAPPQYPRQIWGFFVLLQQFFGKIKEKFDESCWF